jgi:hypothetical protein
VLPPDLGRSFTFVAREPTTTQGCLHAVVDESGNLAVPFGIGSGFGIPVFIHFYLPDGTDQGRITAYEVFPEGCGFEGHYNAFPMADFVGSWAPNTSLVQGPPAGGDIIARAFRAFPHGVLTVLQHCHGGLFSNSPLDVEVQNVDAQGKLISSFTFESICEAPVLTAGTDLLGNIFLVAGGDVEGVGFPADEISGRWFDAHGTALTNWFALSQGFVLASTQAALMPGANGGVLVQLDSLWKFAVASGTNDVELAPAFIANSFVNSWTLVRGGRAYAATVPGSDFKVFLFSANGEECGTLSFLGETVTVGADGSIVVGSGIDLCTQTVYPQLLR